MAGTKERGGFLRLEGGGESDLVGYQKILYYIRTGRGRGCGNKLGLKEEDAGYALWLCRSFMRINSVLCVLCVSATHQWNNNGR